MIKAIMHGCNGKMGQVISEMISQDQEITIVAGIDPVDNKSNPYPVFATIEECNIEGDVVIDFASARAISGLLAYCSEHGLPVVLCTTGMNDEQLEMIEAASKKTAVLKSANMSLGVNLLLKLVKEAASILYGAGFDMEVVEKHHNQKVDAPSGTALALADALKEGAADNCTYIYDRSKERVKRDNKEIGIHAVRGGTIVGEHEVLFAGRDEIVEFKHTAYSKEIFAKGAIEAAKFMAGKPAGYYSMTDVIG